MSKHTPGPWSYRKCQCGMEGCSQFTISVQGSVGFQEADARLIADAPRLYEENQRLRNVNAELLAALKELVEIVDGAISDRSTGNMDSFTLQPARIAITKAEDKP